MRPRFLPKLIVAALLMIIAEESFFTTKISNAMIRALEPPHQRMHGLASYYSYECADQPMANGMKFDPTKRTCASWFYDFNTVLVVKSTDTGLSTEVVVTDRGPNRRLVSEGRIIDLSEKAFSDICDTGEGLARVIVTVKYRPQKK